jgi:hypothetical protein
MGTLTPGATYIYERANGRIYAREFGQTDRKLVGYDVGVQETESSRRMMTQMNEVLIMCEQCPDMKELLDKLFVLYSLRKTHE